MDTLAASMGSSSTPPPAPAPPSLIVAAVQTSASLAACYLFTSLLPELRAVQRAGTTGAMPLLPLTSMFANCVLWCLYGLLARDYFPLVATNAVGIGCSTFYLLVYERHAPAGAPRRRVRRYIALVLGGLVLVALYPVFSVAPHRVTQQHVGYLAIAVCAVMFGSPLVVVREVVRRRSTAALPLPMILAGVLNSVLWLTYGLILEDMVVIAPNVLNLVLGTTQLGLFCVFPRHQRPYEAVEEGPTMADVPTSPTTMTKASANASAGASARARPQQRRDVTPKAPGPSDVLADTDDDDALTVEMV